MSKVRTTNFELGFTLLEIMLVLILLAGSGFYLLIKLPVDLQKQRLTFESTQLLEEIRDARQAAMAENNWYMVKFRFQAGGHYYQIFQQGKLIKNVYLMKGIEFLGQPGDTNGELKFNALGRSAGTTITLTNSLGEQKSVIVAPVGMRIREM